MKYLSLQKKYSPGVRLPVIFFGIISSALLAQVIPSVGTTKIARWKDDKKAAFLLMFDDSILTDFTTVIPELQRRGMIATFYVNPGSAQWRAARVKWEKEIPATGMVYANHTMTRKGVSGMQNAEEEIGKCTDVILGIFPGKQPRLMSFGPPGVAKGAWNITEPELKEVLAKHNLIERPDFSGHGAMIAQKTAAEMTGLVDKALASGGMEYIVFHGVGGDWIVTPTPFFIALLDYLKSKQDEVWVTDHISEYKYATERDAATAQSSVLGQQIRVNLNSTADPLLYDFPLTLVTQVPAGWQKCLVIQGAVKTTVVPEKGVLRYEAIPDGSTITIQQGL